MEYDLKGWLINHFDVVNALAVYFDHTIYIDCKRNISRRFVLGADRNCIFHKHVATRLDIKIHDLVRGSKRANGFFPAGVQHNRTRVRFQFAIIIKIGFIILVNLKSCALKRFILRIYLKDLRLYAGNDMIGFVTEKLGVKNSVDGGYPRLVGNSLILLQSDLDGNHNLYLFARIEYVYSGGEYSRNNLILTILLVDEGVIDSPCTVNVDFVAVVETDFVIIQRNKLSREFILHNDIIHRQFFVGIGNAQNIIHRTVLNNRFR